MNNLKIVAKSYSYFSRFPAAGNFVSLSHNLHKRGNV